jgi:arsenite-transporting ATPase
MRIILFSGKGGVGKTTVSAATGVNLAGRGYRTVVVSLDPAHSLADAFDLSEEERLSAKGLPLRITDNLFIQEIDIQEDIDRYWGDVYRFLELLFNTTGLDEILSEELAILPGMEEVTSLLYINKYYREKEFDVLILDLPPTGESLRFVSMPVVLKWYMKKVFKTERLIMKVARPVAGRFSDIPLPDDSYFQALENFYEKLRGVDEILLNPEITSIRIVTNPEKMVLRESQRAFMYFNLFGVNVDAVIVNRVMEKRDEGCDFLDRWLEVQRKYLREVREFFSPVPIFEVPMLEGEVVGFERLKELSRLIYRERDPSEVFFKEKPYEIIHEKDRYVIKVRAPFVRKEGISLVKGEDSIVIRVGNFKSHILLPRKIRDLEPGKARIKDGYIYIELLPSKS